MPRMRNAVVLAVALCLAACDNTPNAQFEQSEKDRHEAAAGDRYAALESAMPRLRYYIYQPAETRRAYSDGQSGTFRATFASLLAALQADRQIDAKSPLYVECRAAFDEASAYQSGSGSDAAAVRPAREHAVAALQACHGHAQSAKHAGGPSEHLGSVLSRFASAATVMIGAKAVGQGDTDAGLKIWRAGETLASNDRPGFKVNARSFAPQGTFYQGN